MKGQEFQRIRNGLELTQDELAQVLGFSGKHAISNIETEFRKPSVLVAALMLLLDELPVPKAQNLVSRLKELQLVAKKMHKHKRSHGKGT